MFYKNRIEALEWEVATLQETLEDFMRSDMKKLTDKVEKKKLRKYKKRAKAGDTFGKKIQEFSSDMGMSIGDIAKGARVSYGTVRNAVLGKKMYKSSIARISLFMDRNNEF